ncbi:MAG: hypothetical protein V2I36_19745 [Desulfopila sp.]|jgi:hypothetical protein|nr:hypothetical protein [Desulfopila sp.]
MKLIFVYNADSGVINTVKDISIKLFSPQNYDCFLCSLTHGTFKENPVWRDFRQNSGVEMEFLHRDEFEERYDLKMEYPLVLKKSESLEVVLSRDQLASFSSLEDLIEAVGRLEE